MPVMPAETDTVTVTVTVESLSAAVKVEPIQVDLHVPHLVDAADGYRHRPK